MSPNAFSLLNTYICKLHVIELPILTLYRRILSSMFTFFIGPAKVPVHTKSQVMAALSLPFDRLINRDMKEAQYNRAGLPDVDMEAFLRVVKFAYTGDYTWPGVYEWDAQDRMANKPAKERKLEAPTGQGNVAMHDESCWRRRSYIVTNERRPEDYGESIN